LYTAFVTFGIADRSFQEISSSCNCQYNDFQQGRMDAPVSGGRISMTRALIVWQAYRKLVFRSLLRNQHTVFKSSHGVLIASLLHISAPYGRVGWFSLLVTFFAMLFFCLSAFKCWLTVSGLYDEVKIFVGYWSRELPEYAMNADGQDRNYCVSWDAATKDSLFDGSWKFGKAVGIVGAMLSIIIFIVSIYTIFYKIATRFFSSVLCSCVVMAVFSLLLLSGLGSDVCTAELCRIGPGGYLAIFTFFLWLGAAALAFKLKALSQEPEYEYPDTKSTAPSPQYPQITDGVEHQVEMSENDDGTITKRTIITTKSPGGRKKRVDSIKRIMPPEEP
jgi:hypothetical protein